MLDIRKRFDLKGHKDSIYAIDYDGVDNRIFTAGNDGLVASWNPEDGEGKIIAKAENSIYTLNFLGGNKLAIGENYKGIRILNLEKNDEEKFYPIDNLQIFNIYMSEEEGIVAACSDGWIYFFGENGNDYRKIQFSDKNVRSLLRLGDGRLLAGFSDEKIRVLTFPELKVEKEFQAHEKSVFSMAKTSDEKWLITVGRDAKIKTWSLEHDFKQAGDIPAHHYAINNLSLSKDGKHFVTCSMDKTIKVWDTFKGKLLKVIDSARHEGHTNSVNNIIWYGRDTIASVGDDNALMLWEMHGLA